MRRNLIIFASILIIGIVAGMWLCRELHPAHRPNEEQRDTIIQYVKYSPLELKDKTIRIDVPKVGLHVVYIPYDSIQVVYRDNIQYITAPRQFYHTKTDKAEIWHSGIDSRIDSLAVMVTETRVQQAIKEQNRHSIGVGIEANYARSFAMPVQLEYSYAFRRYASVYGYAEYELFTHQFGVGIGLRMQIDW